MTHSNPMMAAQQFVVDEARLLNEARYPEWIALFAADGHYWVPMHGAQQPDPVNHVSLAYEDRILLATRVQRLQGLRAHSLEPGARSLHILQTPQAQPLGGVDWEVYTPFVYTEIRGTVPTTLTGIWRHQLRAKTQGFEIVLKRVDLLNASAAHEMIQLFP
ncbi:aromatic-ring-hydroxylating dioxygenase subunit beta [Curvibacter sp. HBC61]|uniref:Aromatic-ring-hydroxylating dioxygenase subunit beta n=1 Tax=Curvibacter cyanobacteriorum TaxID=3026422 RepID=A0ABT5MYK9_9BURK|nr:aromatic-ring-hydroxylating dioxygenase subunit beta [Curvibacter sp. HBC61]MDD0839134.1 aromatic-ring-hydroxylating dioxygenase subunit beta [Curvibacter sp. HBC61]